MNINEVLLDIRAKTAFTLIGDFLLPGKKLHQSLGHFLSHVWQGTYALLTEWPRMASEARQGVKNESCLLLTELSRFWVEI